MESKPITYTQDELAEALGLSLADIRSTIELLTTLRHDHVEGSCRICRELRITADILEDNVRDIFGNPISRVEQERTTEFLKHIEPV